ncbi:MAG: class I SAM-dependent methyltransferase [Pseudomonadota bacterium]
MKLLKKFRFPKLSQQTPPEKFSEYETSYPTLQNAVDALPGWNHAFPQEMGITAGHSALSRDTRIQWLIDELGTLEDMQVLELGPLEGWHTRMLQNAGAKLVDAIEAHKTAFLRCLVVKNACQLDRSHFYLGDFIKWMENPPRKYDVVVASGVLYHMNDPLNLLELMSNNADTVFLWTHYFCDEEMPIDDLRRTAIMENMVVSDFHGEKIRMYPRSYYNAWELKNFCGGPEDLHYWIEKEDILKALRVLGYNQIDVAQEMPDHPNGPSFCVLARRHPA